MHDVLHWQLSRPSCDRHAKAQPAIFGAQGGTGRLHFRTRRLADLRGESARVLQILVTSVDYQIAVLFAEDVADANLL